jgi:regulator of sigma E protease
MNDLLNNVGLPIISFLVVLGPLIFLHELGHFIALRLTGVTVLEFGIGFPPRAVKLFEQGGTIFSLNWLPLGGFVRPLGEDFVRPLGEDATEQDRAAYEKYQQELATLGHKVTKTKSLLEATPWQRIFFFIAGIVMNMVTALVLFVLVSMLGQPGPGVGIATLEKGSPADLAGLKPDDIILSIAGKPYTYDKDIKANLTKFQGTIPVVVKRDNQQVTVNLTTDTTTKAFVTQPHVLVTEVVSNSPAEKANLQAGDVITKIDDLAIKNTDDLQKYVKSHGDQTVKLYYDRDGQSNEVDVIPRANPPAGQGPIGITIGTTSYYGKFGWSLVDTNLGDVIKLPLDKAIPDGYAQMRDATIQVFGAPFQLIAGKISPSEARPGSVVAISQIGASVLLQSIKAQEPYPILRFAALISISLAFVNLLPIPGLDGGRILFVLIELVRGRPMNPEREGLVHMVGLLALLALSAILIVNDIINPITNSLPKP